MPLLAQIRSGSVELASKIYPRWACGSISKISLDIRLQYTAIYVPHVVHPSSSTTHEGERNRSYRTGAARQRRAPKTCIARSLFAVPIKRRIHARVYTIASFRLHIQTVHCAKQPISPAVSKVAQGSLYPQRQLVAVGFRHHEHRKSR